MRRTVLWIGLCLGAVLTIGNAGSQGPGGVRYLDQGWSEELRARFYFTPQGSRLIPLAWFLALERADGPGRFAESGSLARYGFIAADGPHPLNPAGLPIGFAVETDGGGQERQLGLTCAACHTSNVEVQGRTIRVDGGPANIDFDRFLADLERAVTQTYFDEARFRRFAAELGHREAPAIERLRGELRHYQAQLAGEAAVRRPAIASGFGRVDALTQIVNALSVTAQGEPSNLRPAAAPTSFPHLWLTPQLEFVQWNPIASSPIGRNGGEALGVFAASALAGDPQNAFTSSIRLRELAALEDWLTNLRSPRWDESLLGPIDRALAGQGEALYREHCASCHSAPPYRMTEPSENHFGRTFVAVTRVPHRDVGTDPTYVEALSQRSVRTNAVTAPLLGGAAIVPAPDFFAATVGAILQRAMDAANLTLEERLALNGFRFRPPAQPGHQPQPYAPPNFTDLRAVPLEGAWATGPFLHNGSVPTIYELLSPPAERRPVFFTGGRELDRQRLGFVSDDAPGRFRFDTSIPGNRNFGHVYPPQGLTPAERFAIIEFLKTL